MKVTLRSNKGKANGSGQYGYSITLSLCGSHTTKQNTYKNGRNPRDKI